LKHSNTLLQKINAKNTWSLPLIDHMDRIIADGGGDDDKPVEDAAEGDDGTRVGIGGAAGAHASSILGMDFQRASCTLDASV